jgi:hypothetical protein
MIITQMLCFGLEDSSTKVVVLVTGDQGYRYPASILAQKGCTVILVTTGPLRGKYEKASWNVSETILFRTDLLKLPPKEKQPQ